ncbi:MAG: transporter substrate-binding domain-containing protein [Clostridia bacterium]|nr:transporter substrate-binding domain-containing protein [Clostridia bacterium]
MKKIIALILALAVCTAVFTGCTVKEKEESTTAEVVEVTDEASEEEVSEEASEEKTDAEQSELEALLANADGKLADIIEAGTITIATEGAWSPWTYHDETSDELTGFDVEMGKEIAARLGVQADFKETTWDAILSGVQSGRFDIACNGVGYTEERAESYNFSEPYIYTKQVLLVGADNEDITSYEDLKGKTTANSVGSTYAAVAEEYGATVTNVDTLDQTIELLLQGRIDATINAEVSYLDYINVHPDAAIKVVAKSEGEKVAIPTAKENTDSLVKAINLILEDMRADGTLTALSEQFFGGDITNP